MLPNIYRRVNIYPSEIIQKLAEEGTLLNSFSEATIREWYLDPFGIVLIPNPDKDITKKENCKPISLMNTDTKIINKY